MHHVTTNVAIVNTALALAPEASLHDHHQLVSRVIGPCTYALDSGDLCAFRRLGGASGIYVLDTRNGNLFFEPQSVTTKLNDAGILARLERSLFERKVKLAFLRDESWTLEDAFERYGPDIEQLVAGLSPTVEIFDLTRMSGAIPLARVQATAKFAAHPVLPIIAMSQPVHTSECEPSSWDMDIASPRRVG